MSKLMSIWKALLTIHLIEIGFINTDNMGLIPMFALNKIDVDNKK